MALGQPSHRQRSVLLGVLLLNKARVRLSPVAASTLGTPYVTPAAVGPDTPPSVNVLSDLLTTLVLLGVEYA